MTSGLAILLRQFRSPPIYILVAAAAVTIALDEYVVYRMITFEA